VAIAYGRRLFEPRIALGAFVSPPFGEQLRLWLVERAPRLREPVEVLFEYPTAFLLASR
jgi:hypothetical protein